MKINEMYPTRDLDKTKIRTEITKNKSSMIIFLAIFLKDVCLVKLAANQIGM
jgi:hypothetical protein